MKKFLAILLALSFVLALAACGAVAQPAEVKPEPTVEAAEATDAPAADEKEPGSLPGIGDKLSGFTVTDSIPMDALGATGLLFEHEKSGAELLYLACDDTNRSFNISFRTPALDDKGKPHVFEHITICGSQKYPDANMFFPVIYQTYNTFVNAMTHHGMTSFPVASLSEEQLMTMMDYYLSGVFQPLLYSEPKMAQREAWRYELTDPEAELNIAGTVYSEMQGALTLSAQAADNNFKTLYQGSTTAYVSGGVPENIRTLSYEELVEFHDAYYHPSNALITLYGDMDIARMLEYIDREYLSAYDRTDIDVDMGKVEPATKTTYAEYTAAVEQNAVTEKASEIYYSFALNGADMYDTLALSVLSGALLQESSPIIKVLRERLPEAKISGYCDMDSPSAPYFTVYATGVDPEDRDIFVAAVDEGLGVLREQGLDEEALDAVLSLQKLSLLTTTEDTDLGVNASIAISLGWTYFGSVEYYSTYEKVIDEMTAESADTLLEKYLYDNLHRAVSVTRPEAGLAERNAEALAAELAEKKAAMSEEEIAELVKSTQEFLDWGNTPASEELMAQIANMEVSELPEELRHYDVSDETRDGVRYLSAAADVSGVFSGSLMLDGGCIPVDDLLDTQICLLLMGELDTDSHSKEELSTLITRYLSGLSASLTASLGYNGAEGFYAADLSWIGLGEDAETSVALLRELLLETDYSDTATIKGLLKRWSSDFSNQLDGAALNVQMRRCAAMLDDYSAYLEYVNDYELYQHELALAELADTDPAALTARLEEAREQLLNRNGATVLCAGGQKDITAYEAQLEKLLGELGDESRERVDYSVLRIPLRSEGLVNNSTVFMNMLYSSYRDFTGADIVTSSLINDSYMLPQLRNALGAYGAYSALSPNQSALYTYRDPNLEGSYEIFNALPEYLRTGEMSQEYVDSYIIGSYTSLSRPKGLLSGAINAMTDKLVGISEEIRTQWMREAKAQTPEGVAAAAAEFESLCEDGVRSSSGTESALLAAGELFDVLIYPDGAVVETQPLSPAA